MDVRSQIGHSLTAEGALFFQVGAESLYERFANRDFPSDRTITSEVGPFLVALEKGLEELGVESGRQNIDGRREDIQERCRAQREKFLGRVEAGYGSAITKDHVSLCLSQSVQAREVSVLSELGCPLEPLTLNEHGNLCQEPHSGGLGCSRPFDSGCGGQQFRMQCGAPVSRALAPRIKRAGDLSAAIEAAVAHVSTNKDLALVEVTVMP